MSHASQWVMSHILLCHVSESCRVTHICESCHTHHSESCHTYSCVTSRKSMSHVTHISGSCHAYLWVMSVGRVTSISESCHTYEWVMSVGRVTTIGDLCHTYEWVMSVGRVTSIGESCHTYEWVMSVKGMRESCHRYERVHVARYEWEWRDVTHAYTFTWLIRTHNSFILIHTHPFSFTGMNGSYSSILIHTQWVWMRHVFIHTHSYSYIRIHTHSQVWMSHVTRKNKSRQTYEWVMAHASMQQFTYMEVDWHRSWREASLWGDSFPRVTWLTTIWDTAL